MILETLLATTETIEDERKPVLTEKIVREIANQSRSYKNAYSYLKNQYDILQDKVDILKKAMWDLKDYAYHQSENVKPDISEIHLN